MIAPFEFSTAARIVFGAGAVRSLPEWTRQLGRKVLLVTGRDRGRAEDCVPGLLGTDVDVTHFAVEHEPSLEMIRDGVALARQRGCEVVVALGGGSALDAGKAIAILLGQPGDVLEYLEVIGAGRALGAEGVPFVAVPSTAGTGSEVTRNAVIASSQHRAKASLRSLFMLPRIAIVDPALTYSVPPFVTAATGLDALTQLIEPYICLRANPLTDALCLEGMRRVAASLRRAFAEGHDSAARENMCVASLYGGLALSNAGLGAVHGLAGVIGGISSAPHGAICAALLPHVMEINWRALQQRQPDHPAIRRLHTVGQTVTGNPHATAEDGIAWVRDLVGDLKIPPLRTYGIERAASDEIVEKSARASSMKANPIALFPNELAEVLERAI